jgi:hypothetical protein
MPRTHGSGARSGESVRRSAHDLRGGTIGCALAHRLLPVTITRISLPIAFRLPFFSHSTVPIATLARLELEKR